MADWRALLARSDIDAVGVAIGPARASMRSGLPPSIAALPLFVEKPPAPTVADSRGSWRDAAAAKGVPVVARLHEAILDREPHRRERHPSRRNSARPRAFSAST